MEKAAGAVTLDELDEASRHCSITIRKLRLTGPREFLDEASNYADRLLDLRRGAGWNKWPEPGASAP